MPELLNITSYQSAIKRFIVGHTFKLISVRSPLLVRTFEPDLMSSTGCKVLDIRRLSKRIVWQIQNGSFTVLHLMNGGCFHWKKAETRPTRQLVPAAFDF